MLARIFNLLAIVIAGLLSCSVASTPAADLPGQTPGSAQATAELPKSIGHERNPQGHHVYSVPVVRLNATDRRSDTLDYYKYLLPECFELKLDEKKQVVTFSTKRELTTTELAEALNHMAADSGEMPYWLEVEARDLPKSPTFRPDYFKVTKLKELPKGLAWFGAPTKAVLQLPLELLPLSIGTLHVTPSTAHCMAHSRFALRVLDEAGKVIWQEDTLALATSEFAVADVDEDGVHEVYLRRNDHGKVDFFLITQLAKPNRDAAGTTKLPGAH
jgi:hypothetical protein